MFCGNCGAENVDGSMFCSNCGADLRGGAVPMKAPGQVNQSERNPNTGRMQNQSDRNQNTKNQNYGKKPSDRTKLILLLVGIGIVSALIGLLAAGLSRKSKSAKEETAIVVSSEKAGTSKEQNNTDKTGDKKPESSSEETKAADGDKQTGSSEETKAAGGDKQTGSSEETKAAGGDKQAGSSSEESKDADHKEDKHDEEINPADLLESAIKAYADKIKSSSNMTHFALVYINGDVVPELVLSYGSAHVVMSEAYTYSKDGLQLLDGVGSDFGAFCYAPEQNMIRSNVFINGGYEIEELYKMKEGKAEMVISFYAYENGKEYKVDDKAVSREEYKKQFDKAHKGFSFKTLNYEEMFSNNSTNLSQLQTWYNNFIVN